MSTIYLYAPSDYSGKWNTLIDTDKIKTQSYIDFEDGSRLFCDEILNNLKFDGNKYLYFYSKPFMTYNSSIFNRYYINFSFKFDPNNDIYIYTDLNKEESRDIKFDDPYNTRYTTIATNLIISINKRNQRELLDWKAYEKWGVTSYDDINCNAAVLLANYDYKSIEKYPFLTEFVINFTSFLLNNNEKLNKFLTIWSNRYKIKKNPLASYGIEDTSNHYMDPDKLAEEMRKLDRREQWIEAGMDEAVEDGYR